MTLRGLTAAPALDGIVDVQTVGSGVSFLYSGPVAELLAALQGLPLSDLTIVEPEFEELFLHFYRNGGTV